MSDCRILDENLVLVVINAFSVCSLSLIVQLSLHVFLVLHIIFMPVHKSVVIVSSVFDLVSKLRVLLGNSNLLLQALFFVV